ncbi:MAG: hypothetical protein NZZ41_07995, partial [Candidatus Dojkabacteria bacterium]|nr:hypothetical protein [Candidatus Dojkabacteria bacterium]
MKSITTALVCILICAKFVHASQEENLFSTSYSLLMSPDRNAIGEGVIITYNMLNKKTHIITGLYSTKFKKSVTDVDPREIAMELNGTFAGLDLDASISVGDISYYGTKKHNRYDILLLGEYNYYRKQWRENNDFKRNWEFMFWTGGGIKYDIDF